MGDLFELNHYSPRKLTDSTVKTLQDETAVQGIGWPTIFGFRLGKGIQISVKSAEHGLACS